MISNEEWQEFVSNREMRLAATSKDFLLFFHFYFADYITHKTAGFQKEIMRHASDPSVEQLGVMAFRESGKSSILTTAFPIWAITGSLQKKFVVIVGRTQELANLHLKSIAEGLDGEIMKKDFWPFAVDKNETNAGVISLPKYGAKIIAMGREQSMRGIRHLHHRPDLIIADDIEDTSSTKNPDARDANYKWLTSELIPIGSDNAKYIFVGNLVHEDSIMSRLKREIDAGERDGVFLEYPIVVDGKPIWPERFKDMDAIKKLERKVGNPVAWMREYMLILVPDDTQLVNRDMIHYYHKLPDILRGEYRKMIVGVDPAISMKNGRDPTAIVHITVIGSSKNRKYYVHGGAVNRQMNIVDTVRTIYELNRNLNHPRFYVEQVAYQQALVQLLSKSGENIIVEGVNPAGDKRSRLAAITYLIDEGIILFQDKGCEELIGQLVNMGVQAHDDLVDALTMPIIAHRDAPERGSAVTASGRRRLIRYSTGHKSKKLFFNEFDHLG